MKYFTDWLTHLLRFTLSVKYLKNQRSLKNRLNIDYNMYFFISDPLSALGHDICQRTDRLER